MTDKLLLIAGLELFRTTQAHSNRTALIRMILKISEQLDYIYDDVDYQTWDITRLQSRLVELELICMEEFGGIV